MMFHLENLGVLFGLFALAVPIVIHLLKRRRFEVHDWGAMQFLPDSSSAQRRRWLDEILLMLLRMAMIALIVLALATPISTGSWLAWMDGRPARDVVLIFDGSYSMDARIDNRPTPWADAVRLATDLLDNENNGDRFAMVVARQPPIFAESDFVASSALREKVDSLPAPRGNPNMPAAMDMAWKHLQSHSKSAAKEIVVFTDKQKHGWADADTLAAFESIGRAWQADGAPSLRVIDVGQGLSNLPSNFALAPVTASRGVVKVGQTLTFRSAVHLSGFEQFARPKTLTVLVNGKRHEDLSLPRNSDLKEGQIPLQWQMKYDKPGPHVVSLFLDADSGSDALVADNQQHIVIDAVAELPVLLIDGELKPVGESSAFFVQQALSAKRVVSYADLKPATIIKEKPAVVVLADAPRLEPSVIEAMDRFLSDGGGLLIAVGERVAREKAYYNDKLHRQGQGWLPARLLDVASSKDGERPEPRGFQHAALDVFRAAPGGVMSQVRFEKWWKSQVDPKARATAIAWLSGGDPFLFEMPYKKGRVILCTTPLDRSWGSTLPNGAEFPVLVNELVFYLAGASQGATTLRNGEPIRLPDPGGSIKKLTVDTPMERKERDVKSWPWTFADTGAIGVYRVQAEDRRWSYLVPPDLRESDLTRCSDADWRQVRERLPAAWQEGAAPTPTTESSESQRKELWWLFLIGVIGLLCCELWLTRRMAMARGH